MLISKNLHKKSSEISIKTRSTPASLSFIGQVAKHTTVKWTISTPALNKVDTQNKVHYFIIEEFNMPIINKLKNEVMC